MLRETWKTPEVVIIIKGGEFLIFFTSLFYQC